MKWINLGEKTKLAFSMALSRMINAFRDPAKLQYDSILCIKNDEIGDMCYSTHVFSMLRLQYPAAKISVLCKGYCKPMLQDSADIDFIATDWKQLKGPYDLIVELRTTWKSMFYSIRQWPKARLDRGTVRLMDATAGRYPHETETNFKVVEPLIENKNKRLHPQLYISREAAVAADEYIKQHGLERFAILHSGARKVLRQWPVHNFSTIAQYLKQRGLDIVFTGDSTELNAIEESMKLLPFRSYSTAGILSLPQLAALMKKATIYIGNESGPLHMSSVQGVPSIGLYGPGPAHIFYPAGDKSAVLHHVLECNPCDQIHCVHPENPCINRITVTEVKQQIDRLMDWQ